MYICLYTCGMVRRYSVAEARAHLPSIIDQAEGGEPVELTRRGRLVAVVLSPDAYQRLGAGRPRFRDVYRAFLNGVALDEVGLDEDFAKSVRDRSPGRKVKL